MAERTWLPFLPRTFWLASEVSRDTSLEDSISTTPSITPGKALRFRWRVEEKDRKRGVSLRCRASTVLSSGRERRSSLFSLLESEREHQLSWGTMGLAL